MYYRRSRMAGASYFFTVNLADRSSRLLVDYIANLRQAVAHVKREHPFEIIASVVLPDHLHAVWTLPADDADFPLRWSLIKARFMRSLPRSEWVSASRLRKHERGIWQRRFWEHRIRDDDDMARHVDYVHINPVKHGHVRAAVEWPYSSIHRYVRQGILPADWGGGVADAGAGFGERR